MYGIGPFGIEEVPESTGIARCAYIQPDGPSAEFDIFAVSASKKYPAAMRLPGALGSLLDELHRRCGLRRSKPSVPLIWTNTHPTRNVADPLLRTLADAPSSIMLPGALRVESERLHVALDLARLEPARRKLVSTQMKPFFSPGAHRHLDHLIAIMNGTQPPTSAAAPYTIVGDARDDADGDGRADDLDDGACDTSSSERIAALLASSFRTPAKAPPSMYTVLNDKATPFKFDITFGLDGSRPDASHITAVVAGPTGAGKSTRVRTMLQEYARVYGQANVRFFILTHHERDPAYDGLEPAILRIPYERVMAESDAERASKRARTTRARESAAAAATAADDTSDNDGSQAVEDPFADADDLAGAQSAVRDAGIAIIAPLGVDVPVLDINPDELISGFTGGLMDVEGHAGIHALPVSKLLEYDAYHARGVRTVIVFDDADFSGDKRVDAAIHRFKTMCMSYGRKCKISTVVVAHAIMSGRTTSAFLKEAAWKIMFPGTTLGQADALQYFVDKRRWAPAMAQQFLVAMACQPWLLVCEIEPAFMLSPCCLIRM